MTIDFAYPFAVESLLDYDGAIVSTNTEVAIFRVACQCSNLTLAAFVASDDRFGSKGEIANA